MRDLPVLKLDLKKPETFGNVAEKLDVHERRALATDLIELIRIDEQSMSTWVGEARGYLQTVEAGRGSEAPENREQEGSGETEPPSTEMTLTSVIQFSARATGALLGEPDLAKASEPGAEPLAKWVSSQVRTKDPNWVLETDPLVVHMSVTGLAWRKRAFDEFEKDFHSYFCKFDEIIINANVRSVERAPRITHQFTRYPYEIDRSIRRKHWVDYEPKYDDTADPQAPKKFYECDLWIDLDGDKFDEPWTVTISIDDMAEVVKIAPRWSRKTIVEDDENLFFHPIRRFYPYRFLPDPDGGFFPMGFGKLLSRVESSADNLLASITDTAKSEGENGGVMAGGGTGLPSSSIELKNNRIATIPTDGRPLGDMFQPFPTKQVSQGSVAVLEKLITLGDRIAGTLNLLENAPASMTATLAKGLIDNGTQVQSAVHRRLVASMTQEFHMFIRMADAYDVLPPEVSVSDVSSVAVTADPQMATEMQRGAMGGLYKEMLSEAAAGVPWNVSALQTRFCEVMRIPNPQELIAQPQPAQASPKEKIDGIVAMEKAKTDRMKVQAGVAVQMTQALKNLVDAGGGLVDTQAATLQMAQLEDAIQKIMAEAQNGDAQLGGMAQGAGNPSAPALPAPAAPGEGDGLPAGTPGGADPTGAGEVPQ